MENNFRMNINRVLFFFVFFCIIALSAYMQFTSSMNLDACNALHESKLLFSGGKYFYDFYETTPPMFLYMDFPIVIITKYFPSLYFFTAFFAYYVFLSVVSLLLINTVSKKFFNQDNLRLTFLLFIFSVFLLEPAYYFGQREHTAFILTTPFFFLYVLRLEKIEIDQYLCWLIGVLAGIGFSIKPQFCLAFLISEIYLLIVRKSFLKAIRVESCIIYTIFLLYAVLTYLLYPEYFNDIIPLSAKFYYFGIAAPFSSLFMMDKFYYIALSVFLFFISLTKKNYSLSVSFFIAMVGYFATYLSQLVPWDYHIFPAYAFAILLNMSTIMMLTNTDRIGHIRILFYAFLLFICFEFNVYHLPNHHNLFLIVFFGLLLASIGLLFELRIQNKLTRFLILFGLMILLFIFPVENNLNSYSFAHFIKRINNPIVDFLHKNAENQPVYFLESVLNYEYPNVDYAEALHVSRFCYLVWMPAFLHEMQYNSTGKMAQEMQMLNYYFVDLLSKDIAIKKPKYILVDASRYISTPVFSVHHFSYVNFFLQFPEFRLVWKFYHYIGVIDNDPNYRLAIYKINQ